MCGRYTLHTERELLERRFAVSIRADAWLPRYNVAPTQDVWVVRERDGERRADLMRWGLVPFWTKPGEKRAPLINARRESLTRRSFRRTFERRRCLIPADGFYEWQPTSGPSRRKIPHWIGLTSREPFAFAGLWEAWHDPGLLETPPLLSCAIITAPANQAIAPLHDRMPVILPREAEEAWLDPALDGDVETLLERLEPVPASAIAHHPVSTRVNKHANDDPELIRPDDSQPELGFFDPL